MARKEVINFEHTVGVSNIRESKGNDRHDYVATSDAVFKRCPSSLGLCYQSGGSQSRSKVDARDE